jgi:hypothetical protein
MNIMLPENRLELSRKSSKFVSLLQSTTSNSPAELTNCELLIGDNVLLMCDMNRSKLLTIELVVVGTELLQRRHLPETGG